MSNEERLKKNSKREDILYNIISTNQRRIYLQLYEEIFLLLRGMYLV